MDNNDWEKEWIASPPKKMRVSGECNSKPYFYYFNEFVVFIFVCIKKANVLDQRRRILQWKMKI
jgi:hypothetical protein